MGFKFVCFIKRFLNLREGGSCYTFDCRGAEGGELVCLFTTNGNFSSALLQVDRARSFSLTFQALLQIDEAPVSQTCFFLLNLPPTGSTPLLPALSRVTRIGWRGCEEGRAPGELPRSLGTLVVEKSDKVTD